MLPISYHCNKKLFGRLGPSLEYLEYKEGKVNLLKQRNNCEDYH